MFYNARWYDPALGRMAQADTVVPSGVQGYDRYAYTSNNPLRYIDPTGHCVQKGDAPPESRVNRNICRGAYPVPSGLSPNAQRAVRNMIYGGLWGNDRAAMGYVVGTEFTTGIVDSVMIERSQGNYLFQAIANLYRTYCSSGSWTARCLNSFCAYNEGPLTGREMPSGYSGTQAAMITDIASAILHPGSEFGTNGFIEIKANPAWNGGCETGSGSANFCHYATKAPGLHDWLDARAQTYGPANQPGQSWSYWPAGTAKTLCAWWNGNDVQGNPEIAVVMTQAMYDALAMPGSEYCPSCLY